MVIIMGGGSSANNFTITGRNNEFIRYNNENKVSNNRQEEGNNLNTSRGMIAVVDENNPEIIECNKCLHLPHNWKYCQNKDVPGCNMSHHLRCLKCKQEGHSQKECSK